MDLLAQEAITNPVLNSTVGGASGVDFFNLFLPKFVGLALVLGIVIFLFIMLLGAIQWIASGGDKAGVEGARGKITNAVVGIVILLATFAVVKVVEDFFGINILSINVGPLIIN